MRFIIISFLFIGVTASEIAGAGAELTMACKIKYCDPSSTPCTMVEKELRGYQRYAGIKPIDPREWSSASNFNYGPLCFGSDPHRFKDLYFLVAPLYRIDPEDGPRDQKPNLSLYVKYWFNYSWYKRIPFSNGNQAGSTVDLTFLFDEFCGRPVTQKEFKCTLIEPVPDSWGYYK